MNQIKLIAVILALLSTNILYCTEIKEVKDLIEIHDNNKLEQVIQSDQAIVNAKDKDGFTPLHYAASLNNKDAAELLLNNGADIDAKDNWGKKTPLHLAAMSNSKGVAELLLKAGANVNTKTDNNSTPLHYAAGYDKIEVAQLLLDNGANVNAKNNRGQTPLHDAAHGNSQKVAKLLIKKGANIDAKDNNGDTPLHSAIEYNAKGVAKLLIDNNADIAIKNENKKTPLDEATNKSNFQEIVKLLTEKNTTKEALANLTYNLQNLRTNLYDIAADKTPTIIPN